MGLGVTYFYRQPGNAYSIEGVFATVRREISDDYMQTEFFCPHRRAKPRAMWDNCRQAKQAASAVNHITGEVHYLTLSLPKRGLVLTIHDTGDTNHFGGLKRLFFHYFWFVLPVRRAAAVTFISETSRKAVEAKIGFIIPQAHVIPNPVSPIFQHSSKAFPTRSPRILCLGTKANKNIERLAEAARGLDFEIRIIGKPNESQRSALEAMGATYSFVTKLSDAEILAEYQAADVIALVSTFEGFGLPIVEGQAVGRPVITSNISPMTNTAADGALFVDPFSVDDIRAGLIRLRDDSPLRNALVERGLENVKRFRPDAIARQYEAVYQSVIS